MDELKVVNCSPAEQQFLQDVLIGLGSNPKTLPPKYFYDDAGARLFEAICDLEEYYLTRTEMGVLKDHSSAIAAAIGSNAMLIEYGSGSLEKIRILLDVLETPKMYVPVDISERQLIRAAECLRNAYPELIVAPIVTDFTAPFILPSIPETACSRVAFFPGSTIGNFDPEPAKRLLSSISDTVGHGGGLLIGIDLKKDVDLLISAYDDKSGITEAFNKNLLVRINRELGGDFSLDDFHHVARFNTGYGCVEMHLESVIDQTVAVGNRSFNFAAGETIHTENSYKYTLDEFDEIAKDSGFKRQVNWTDSKALFAVVLYVRGL